MNNQMNSAVRKIHNLLSSGAVTVTGPNQPRILKQKVGSTTVTPTNNLQQVSSNAANRCYICDDLLGASQAQHSLTENSTSHTATKFPNKIGQLVGDAFMVIVSVDDVVCSRCTNLLNYLDRLENDVERVRTNLMNLLHKKYGLNDEGGGGSTPPIKMQKLNSGSVTTREEMLGEVRTRKITHNVTESSLGKQSPPVSAVQQIKISTQPVQQNTAGTQTLQRKTTKIYKCLSCDYKTSDMRLFNTHYETCKQQNFQCKNCKKIFPNFGAMKQHMVREHNTPMDNTCAVCHINFVNEAALRKHMEMNHSTNVVVTSTTTVPATPIDSITSGVTSTPLYTCNHCQFKSTDKALFDEHLRKHLSGVKPKPFKCRLCAARFETREAATVHAKQHQPNYFKCGTCSMSFPKRELLVKHFEVHQQQPQQQQHVASVAVTSTNVVQQTTNTQSNVVAKQQQQHQQQSTSSQNMLTQKLLQDTIDEALSDTSTTTAVAATTDGGSGNTTNAAAGNIRFFSCSICSLTFIQENYYNQHMETHRRDKKGSGGGNVGTTITTSAGTNSLNSNNGTASITSFSSAAAELLSDSGIATSSTVSKSESNMGIASAGHQSSASNATGGGAISEADIESIFEKMHSDKGDTGADAVATSASNTTTTNTTSSTSGAGGAQGDNLVITSQEGSGGITFNITIPQPDAAGGKQQISKSTPTSNAPVSVSIDMPMLDQPDETITSSSGVSKSDAKNEHSENETNDSGTSKAPATAAGPVSMPSLDDDNDSHEHHHALKSEDGTEKEVKKENSEAKDSGGHDGAHDDEQVKTETEQKDDVKAEDDGGGAGTLDGHATHTTDGDGGEGEAANAGDHQQQVSMELDEAMQAQVESGQIKFILNENGQLLQLDNHIITDADGNQILVQDPEQIQQLLQSVGVLQSGDGLDGETLQMMTDANGQMVLVQGENNETQLIDASLLNADGQLVIQQGQDGELGEGAHVIGEDGTRIPVSVSYTADGQPIVQVQQQHLEAAREATQQRHALDKDRAAAEGDGEGGASGTNEEEGDNADAAGDATASGGNGGDSGGGGFFELEELMQQSSEAKAAE